MIRVLLIAAAFLTLAATGLVTARAAEAPMRLSECSSLFSREALKLAPEARDWKGFSKQVCGAETWLAPTTEPRPVRVSEREPRRIAVAQADEPAAQKRLPHRAKLHKARPHRAELHKRTVHHRKLYGSRVPGSTLHSAKLHGAKLHAKTLRSAKRHPTRLHARVAGHRRHHR